MSTAFRPFSRKKNLLRQLPALLGLHPALNIGLHRADGPGIAHGRDINGFGILHRLHPWPPGRAGPAGRPCRRAGGWSPGGSPCSARRVNGRQEGLDASRFWRMMFTSSSPWGRGPPEEVGFVVQPARQASSAPPGPGPDCPPQRPAPCQQGLGECDDVEEQVPAYSSSSKGGLEGVHHWLAACG